MQGIVGRGLHGVAFILADEIFDHMYPTGRALVLHMNGSGNFIPLGQPNVRTNIGCAALPIVNAGEVFQCCGKIRSDRPLAGNFVAEFSSSMETLLSTHRTNCSMAAFVSVWSDDPASLTRALARFSHSSIILSFPKDDDEDDDDDNDDDSSP